MNHRTMAASLAALLLVSVHAFADPPIPNQPDPYAPAQAKPAPSDSDDPYPDTAPPKPEPEWKVNQRREALSREAQKLAGEGRWREALEKFRKVIEIRSHPRMLLWSGYAEEQLGKLVNAKAIYTLARKDAQEAKLKDELAGADQALAALQPKIPRLHVRLPPNVEVAVMIDSARIDVRAEPVEVDPGAHVVLVTARDRVPFRKEVTAAAGSTVVVDVVLTPVPPPPPPPAPPPPQRVNTDPIFVGVIGATLVTGGGILLGMGIKQSPPSVPLQGIGVGMLVLGAGAGVGALVWGLGSSSKPKPENARAAAPVGVSVAPIHGGAFAGFSGSF
jgi:hypothetical protein